MKCPSQREHHKYAMILKQEKTETAHIRNEKVVGLFRRQKKRGGGRRVSEGTSYQKFVKWKKIGITPGLKETFFDGIYSS